MTLEEVIFKTKEHMDTCDADSEEYEILAILLECVEAVKDIRDKF
mgnify:CR=1 FL=1